MAQLSRGSYTKIESDDRFVNVPGDTMTGELIITPVSGTNSLKANKDITIKTSKKVIYDGA